MTYWLAVLAIALGSLLYRLSFLGGRRAQELIRAYGAERFLFGSDYPMWDPAACLDDFLALNLSEHERDLILCKNALAILGIEP
jgi:predicted TIM-barrel fold metal-dependent hydrolase